MCVHIYNSFIFICSKIQKYIRIRIRIIRIYEKYRTVVIDFYISQDKLDLSIVENIMHHAGLNCILQDKLFKAPVCFIKFMNSILSCTVAVHFERYACRM